MASSTEDKITNNYENFIKLIKTSSAGQTVLTTRLGKDERELIVSLTDGQNVWKTTVNQQSKDYFTKLCSAFMNAEIKIPQPQDVAHLSLYISGNVVELDLPEISAADADKQSELQRVLFRAVERAEDLEARLKTSESKVEALQKKAASATKNVFDIGYDSKKRKKAVPKTAPKQAGMSVVNPGSKKRAAPKGVEFD